MNTLELSVIVLGFVGGWFSRKGLKFAIDEMALRRHRNTLKNFNWRR